MSTISTEQAKDLRMAFAVWQQDYDPVEDKAQYEMFGLGIVAMDELLALRKERERAEPVYQFIYNNPYEEGYAEWLDCNKDYFNGVPEDCRRILYTAPPAPVVPGDWLPFDPQIAEYEQMMEAEQAQADTTSQQFESLVGKAVSGWIPCSERLPPEKTGVLVATEFDGPGDWRMKWGTRVPGHPDAKNGWFIPGASWDPSYWQPLPEPPCK
ncbi:DUF551 domain-containing protein [Cronobacter turicensis]